MLLSDLYQQEKTAAEEIPDEDLVKVADLMKGWELAESFFGLEKKALTRGSVGARLGAKASKKMLAALEWLSGGDKTKQLLLAGAIPAAAVAGTAGVAAGRMSKESGIAGKAIKAVVKSPVARTLAVAGGAAGAAGAAGHALGEEAGVQREKDRREQQKREERREALRQRILARLRAGYGYYGR